MIQSRIRAKILSILLPGPRLSAEIRSHFPPNYKFVQPALDYLVRHETIFFLPIRTAGRPVKLYYRIEHEVKAHERKHQMEKRLRPEPIPEEVNRRLNLFCAANSGLILKCLNDKKYRRTVGEIWDPVLTFARSTRTEAGTILDVVIKRVIVHHFHEMPVNPESLMEKWALPEPLRIEIRHDLKEYHTPEP